MNAPAKPTKAQLDYALGRINAIASIKQADIYNRFTTRNQPSRITAADLVAGIKSGQIKLRDWQHDRMIGYDDRGYTSWPGVHHLFDLDQVCVAGGKKVDDKAIQPLLTQLKNEVQSLQDQIMLGDLTQALALIQTFEKKRV